MRKVLQKLNSKRGASIVIALMLFLLCALAGASALTMAAANAGRYSHATDDRQPQKSVESAAVLMVALLEGLSYESPRIEYSYTYKWEYTGSDRVGTDAYSLSILSGERDKTDGHMLLTPFNAYEYKADGTFSTEKRIDIPSRKNETSDDRDLRHAVEKSNLVVAIGAQCDRIVPYLSVEDKWYSSVDKEGKTSSSVFMPEDFTYSFTIAPEDGSFGEVRARLVMSANYDLIFSFVYGENAAYAVDLYWEATVSESPEKGEPEYSYLEDGSIASRTTKEIKYVRVTWEKENAHLSRGEAMDTV